MTAQTVKEYDECFTCKAAGKEKVKIFTKFEDMPNPQELEQKFGADLAKQLTGSTLFFDDKDCKIPHIHAKKERATGAANKQQWIVTQVTVVGLSEEVINKKLNEGFRLLGRTAQEATVYLDGKPMIILGRFRPAE